MNFKYFTLCAAVAAAGLTGCSMDSDDAGDIIAKGDKALFTVTVSGPETYALDFANATASEVAVNSIDVYVYDAGMNLVDHARKEGTAIVSVSTNTWTLAADQEIPTTAGSKIIFVGINLTEAMGDAIETNGVDAEISIAALKELCEANKFVMFSTEGANKTLVAKGEDEDNPTINEVSTSVSRLVSKILFYGDTDYTAGGEGTLKNLEFTASNVNNKFYPKPDLANYYDPNFESVNMLNSFFGYNEPTNEVSDFVSVNQESTNPLKAVYATENTAKKGSVAGAFTYGIVKGVYVPKAISYWSGSTLTTSAATAGADFFAVRLTDVDGKLQTLFFDDKNNAELFVSAKIQGGILADHIEEYKGGVCYYGVIFNGAEKAGASEHSIYRNTLYRVTVDAVKGLGSSTWKIKEPYNPLFPPIIIPTVPPGGDEDESALLTVKVGIEPWMLEDPQGTVLGND